VYKRQELGYNPKTGLYDELSELKKKIEEFPADIEKKLVGLATNGIAYKERIEELENELKRVEIIATAKAVVVPEGKGIFWTNKIEALEQKYKEEIAELKNSVWFDYKQENGKKACIHIPNLYKRVDENRDVLRELNQIVKGINYDLSVRKIFEPNIYNHYSERLAELGRKLSGGKKPKGKESQTVLQSGEHTFRPSLVTEKERMKSMSYNSGDSKPEEPKYILSADGYCLNPKKLISEFRKLMECVCSTCSNKPYDSPQCSVFMKGCKLYEFRRIWEQKLQEGEA